MPQLHLYLPKDVADEVKRRAHMRGLSVSAYLSDLVRLQIAPQWPDGYFDRVVGGWSGDPLDRPPQGRLEAREPWT